MSTNAPGHLKKDKQIKEILPLITCFKNGKNNNVCTIERISFGTNTIKKQNAISEDDEDFTQTDSDDF